MKIPHTPGMPVAEVAQKLGVSHKVVWRLVNQGYLDAFVVNSKLFYIIPASLDKYIAQRGAK